MFYLFISLIHVLVFSRILAFKLDFKSHPIDRIYYWSQSKINKKEELLCNYQLVIFLKYNDPGEHERKNNPIIITLQIWFKIALFCKLDPVYDIALKKSR